MSSLADRENTGNRPWSGVLVIQPSFLFSIPPLAWAMMAVLGISAWSLLLRFLLKDEKDYLALGGATEWMAFGLVALAVLVLGRDFAFGGTFDWAGVPLEGWLALLASTALYTAFAILTYRALQTIEASERAVVTELQIGWTVLLSALLLAERITGAGLFGVGLIVAGSFICTFRPGKARWKVEGVRLIALAALLIGTASLADKVALRYFPPLIYTVPQYLVPALVITARMGRKAHGRFSAMGRKYAGPLVLVTAMSVLSYVSYLMALQALPVSVVVPLINLNVIVTAVAGIVLLREREGWPQKMAGALLAFAGAWLMAG